MSGVRASWVDHVETPDGAVLRRLLPEDAAGLNAVHGDPRVYAFDPQETHLDLPHTRDFLAPMLRHWEVHGFGYWTVLVPVTWWAGGVRGSGEADADRVVAGLGGVQHHAVAGRPVLNVYFRFAVATQGRGLGGTVLQQALRLAREVAPHHDVVVRTRPANVAARRVAERAGFLDEGPEPGHPDMQLLRLRALTDPGERQPT